MAGKGFRRNEKWKWTPHVEERLAAIWGTKTAEKVAEQLTREFGQTYSPYAVKHHASQNMGLRAADAQGDICISDAAAELGVPIQTLHALIRRKNLTVTGSGYCRFLTPETWRAVQAFYIKPPEPTITLQEAADRLGRSLDWTYNQVRAQTLKAWKWGANWQVSAADVERFRWDIMKQKRLNTISKRR